MMAVADVTTARPGRLSSRRASQARRRAASGAGLLSRGRGATLAAFALPFVFYLVTLPPTVYNLDSAELTTAAYAGGLVRATGYPLYLLIGRLWSQLPIGDVGFRMNLLSAVCGALTIALAERVLRRLGVGGWATFGALGLLASTRYFWAMSLIAEVYTLHTALLCAIVLALLRWAEKPGPARLALATLLVGLAFGNHVATVLLAPACTWYVLRVAPRAALAPRSLLAAAAGLAAGLSVYLYLPLLYLTQPAFNYAGSYDGAGVFQPVDLTTFEGLWWLVSGRAFAGSMMGYTAGELLAEVGHFGAELWRAFMAVGIGPGLVGLVVLWRRGQKLGSLLLLMFVFSAGFYVNYRVVDKDTMFLPAYVVWALWVAIGYQWLLDWVSEHSRPRRGTGGRPVASRPVQLLRALMVGMVLFALLWNGPLVDLSDDWSTVERGEQVLARAEVDALVIGWWSTVPVVEYLQAVEGRRPDVQALNRFLIGPDELRELLLAEVPRRPVYLDEPPDELLPEFEAVQVGPIFRLSLKDEATPPEADEGPDGATPAPAAAGPIRTAPRRPAGARREARG